MLCLNPQKNLGKAGSGLPRTTQKVSTQVWDCVLLFDDFLRTRDDNWLNKVDVPRMPNMKSGLATVALLASVLAVGQMPAPGSAPGQGADAETKARVRQIILDSRHEGAHGMGYNSESMETLSRQLSAADVPTLLGILADRDIEMRVGVQFALASQCEAALIPVRDAAVAHNITWLDAEDTTRLIEGFDRCPAEVRLVAAKMRSDIETLQEADERRLEQEHEAAAADDARIQRNGLKLLDPEQAKTLTRQEREEVFRRSLKAMGLTEDGPMTPTQRDLVQRMYRTMVLGESGNRPPN